MMQYWGFQQLDRAACGQGIPLLVLLASIFLPSGFHTRMPLDCSMMCSDIITTMGSVPVNGNTLPLRMTQNHNGGCWQRFSMPQWHFVDGCRSFSFGVPSCSVSPSMFGNNNKDSECSGAVQGNQEWVECDLRFRSSIQHANLESRLYMQYGLWFHTWTWRTNQGSAHSCTSQWLFSLQQNVLLLYGSASSSANWLPLLGSPTVQLRRWNEHFFKVSKI